jgi:hypothetical protein
MKILLPAETRIACGDQRDRLAPDATWVSIDDAGDVDRDPTGCEVVFWGADLWTRPERLTPILEQ